MPLFTFELVRKMEAPIALDVRLLQDGKGAWCYVELLAFLYRNERHGRIQVKNAAGEIIILTGIATAIASAKKCREVQCAVKQLLGDTPAEEDTPAP